MSHDRLTFWAKGVHWSRLWNIGEAGRDSCSEQHGRACRDEHPFRERAFWQARGYEFLHGRGFRDDRKGR